MREALNAGVRRAIRMAGMLYGAVWLACLALYWGASRPGASGAVRSWTTRCSCSTSSCPSPGSSRRFWPGTPVALGGWRLLFPLVSAALYHIFTGVTFGLSTSLGLVNIAPAAAPTVGLVGACALPGLIVGMVFDTRAWTRR